jgi:membrane protease YdiL (CAAX protease family)
VPDASRTAAGAAPGRALLRLPGPLRRRFDGCLFGWAPEPAPEPPAVVIRRRRVVAGTAVLAVVLLALTMLARPGSAAFYPLALALAAAYLAGGLLSGPLRLRAARQEGRGGRALGAPLVAGVLAYVFFALAAWAVQVVPPIDHAVQGALHRADAGPRWLILAVAVLTGLGEEVYFRGALFAALGRRSPVVLSTLAYVAVTIATRNVSLVLAAAVMGLLWALERRASGGVLASGITHITWSILMIFLIPR